MNTLIQSIERAAVKEEFSGVISVSRDGSVLFNQAFGYRHMKDRLPNTTGTKFGIASGTKLFTALGIGVLIERGLLSLDTAVGEIDPAYTGFIDESATIQHLLTHTSGIYDYYDEEIEQDFDHFSVEIPWSELETPGDYYPLFQGKAMKFPPGERWSYSNGGYVFLGILIEKISGLLYRDFIHEHVLLPAGMQDSGFYAFNDLPENTASGYFADRKTTNIYQLPLRGGGDGGMYTTSADLVTFWERLFSSRILSEELTATCLKTHSTLSDTTGYGCGIYKRLDDSLYWISGGDAGVGFYSGYQVKQKRTINMLSNITNGEEGMRAAVMSHFE